MPGRSRRVRKMNPNYTDSENVAVQLAINGSVTAAIQGSTAGSQQAGTGSAQPAQQGMSAKPAQQVPALSATEAAQRNALAALDNVGSSSQVIPVNGSQLLQHPHAQTRTSSSDTTANPDAVTAAAAGILWGRGPAADSINPPDQSAAVSAAPAPSATPACIAASTAAAAVRSLRPGPLAASGALGNMADATAATSSSSLMPASAPAATAIAPPATKTNANGLRTTAAAAPTVSHVVNGGRPVPDSTSAGTSTAIVPAKSSSTPPEDDLSDVCTKSSDSLKGILDDVGMVQESQNIQQ